MTTYSHAGSVFPTPKPYAASPGSRPCHTRPGTRVCTHAGAQRCAPAGHASLRCGAARGCPRLAGLLLHVYIPPAAGRVSDEIQLAVGPPPGLHHRLVPGASNLRWRPCQVSGAGGWSTRQRLRSQSLQLVPTAGRSCNCPPHSWKQPSFQLLAFLWLPKEPSGATSATQREVSSHGMLGWSHATHASLLPSGLSRGEEKKSWPLTSVVTCPLTRSAAGGRAQACCSAPQRSC